MIVRARSVVTMDGPPIDDGAVEIAGERIAAVGHFAAIRKDAAGDVFDLGERILLPGLINAHCHLDYTCLRGRIPPKGSFTGWVRSINAEKERLSPDDYVGSINAGMVEATRFGTTSVVNFEAFPNLAHQIKSPMRMWWLGELIDVRTPQSAQNLVDSAAQALRPMNRWGLAPHAPFTASASLYQKCEALGTRENPVLSTHLAESREELQMFRDGSGALFDFLQSIGRDMSDCGKQTPLAHFLSLLDPNSPNEWIIVHLNELTESDFGLLEKNRRKFHIVHCPHSHRYFGHSAFAFEQLQSRGFPVCLATDSLASADSLDLFAEMQLFSELHPAVPPREIVEMVTLNPSRAIGAANSLGRIRSGYYADLIAIDDGAANDPFEQILAHTGTVPWQIVGGLPLS